VDVVVRGAGFLRGVGLWIVAGLVLGGGVVVGVAEGPLELYLVVDRRPASYATITTSSAGEPFQLQAPAPQGGAFGVKLELVQGASAWHSVEQVLSGVPSGQSAREG
jgi:hypothetical protein